MRYMEGTKLLRVSSNFDCFLTNGDCFFIVFEQENAVNMLCDFLCVQSEYCLKVSFDWRKGQKCKKDPG